MGVETAKFTQRELKISFLLGVVACEFMDVLGTVSVMPTLPDKIAEILNEARNKARNIKSDAFAIGTVTKEEVARLLKAVFDKGEVL